MDDGDDMDVSLDGGHTKRACDSCRTRKIRCDRNVPCSNCKASKMTCNMTTPVRKEQRQRVHISEEYVKKIDRIEDRLASIENVLESLAAKLGNLNLTRDSVEASSQSRSSRASQAKSPGALTEALKLIPFGGETTINSQSDYAQKILAEAIGSTHSIGQNAEVKSALHALRELVSQQGQTATTSTYPLLNSSLIDSHSEDLDRPPWNEAMSVLDKAMRFPTMAFSVIFPFLELQNLKELSKDVHGNPATCSATRRILVYGILEKLFTEYKGFPLADMDVSNYGTYAHLCRQHMELAISQLDLVLPANYENITALLVGAVEAVEMCKPSLCWVLISSAASLCLNLGYHRINTMANDTPGERKSKIYVFWMIYMFDKLLSLRLGRASMVQDWDISLPFVLPNETTPRGPEGYQMLSYWVKVARVQGQTYEKLFSPAAFLKPPEERTRIAVELVNAMTVAWSERGEESASQLLNWSTFKKDVSTPNSFLFNKSPNETEVPSRRLQSDGLQFDATEYIQGSFERIQDIFFHADVVMHYSTCALIQRAVTTDNVTFNQECLASSRAALVAHARANSQFNTKGNEEMWSGYIHWSILQAPFTPFIVIFCNAIQRTDSSDLGSLASFVASLESCRTLSEGADKLYKMCHLFLQVAKLYIQAKTKDAVSRSVPNSTQPNYYTPVSSAQIDLNTISQFDPYLSALGLVNNSNWNVPNMSAPPTSTTMSAYTQPQDIGGLPGTDAVGVGFAPPGGPQNSIQDWFSGSRYLMNLLEAGDDLQMQDLEF